MVFVDQEVLVSPGFGEGSWVAQPVGIPGVGDTVMLIPINENLKIAVPILEFSVGDQMFTFPEFQFAGFNFNIDFNFNLIPLRLNLVPDARYHDFKIYVTNTSDWVYGDDPEGTPGCYLVIGGGFVHGEADFAFLFEDGGGDEPDIYMDIRIHGGCVYEIWCGSWVEHAYNNQIWFKNTKLAEGSLLIPERHCYVDAFIGKVLWG